MLPIYICYGSDFGNIERRAVDNAAQEIRDRFDREVIVYGDSAWSDPNKGFSSADWYIGQARQHQYRANQNQLDARFFVELMRREPWQESNPHIDMILMTDDLTAKINGQWLSFCFGLTHGRFIANSVHRYAGLNDRDRFAAIKGVVLHEIGHALGAAANLSRLNTEENIGPHCTNPGCIMRQGSNLSAWVNNTRDCYYNPHGWFCPQCIEDIRRSQM